MYHPRAAKGVVRVHGYLSHTVLREANQLGVAVAREFNPPEVLINDLSKNPLVVTNNDQFSR
jgi:hypothetical protein